MEAQTRSKQRIREERRPGGQDDDELGEGRAAVEGAGGAVSEEGREPHAEKREIDEMGGLPQETEEIEFRGWSSSGLFF